MRLRRRFRIWVLFFGFSMAAHLASAQKNFKYEALIRPIDSTGFYKISLRPAFIAKSKADLSDIRLIDNRGHFMPYITGNNLPQSVKEKFVVFPEVVLKSKTDTVTTFVIQNKETSPVDKLWLRLKNTAVMRSINLSGSDDLKAWFAIEENILLQQSVLNSDGTYLQSLSFPASNYRYLKIAVNDKNKTPVKFLEAGVYAVAAAAVENRYQPIIPVKFMQHDDGKKSNITIRFDGKYLINKLHLTITGSKYFRRKISIYSADTGYGLDVHSPELVSESELTSLHINDILLSAKTNMISLGIDNEDNMPLKITDVQAFQADQYIVSYLEAGRQYQLLTGNAGAKEPSYDLKFFTDSLPDKLPEISHEKVINNTAYPLKKLAVNKNHTIFIWLSIAIALLLLSLLSLRMINELNARK